jgi:putative SOS response-associated peptidase YedK
MTGRHATTFPSQPVPVIRQHPKEPVRQISSMRWGLIPHWAKDLRLQLPERLKWVEVDLPEILDYKEELLKAEKPTCTLRRVRADLSNAEIRRSLLSSLAAEATKVLIITEGTA